MVDETPQNSSVTQFEALDWRFRRWPVLLLKEGMAARQRTWLWLVSKMHWNSGFCMDFFSLKSCVNTSPVAVWLAKAPTLQKNERFVRATEKQQEGKQKEWQNNSFWLCPFLMPFFHSFTTVQRHKMNSTSHFRMILKIITAYYFLEIYFQSDVKTTFLAFAQFVSQLIFFTHCSKEIIMTVANFCPENKWRLGWQPMYAGPEDFKREIGAVLCVKGIYNKRRQLGFTFFFNLTWAVFEARFLPKLYQTVFCSFWSFNEVDMTLLLFLYTSNAPNLPPLEHPDACVDR